MATVYLGLGSNESPEDNLRLAIRELRSRYGDLSLSSVYQSASVGFDGADFLNLVVEKPELTKELMALAAKHDFEFTSEELSEAELDQVAGGTAFQNFDQKANQMYNLLSSVMKSMNEMRMGTTRNML